MSFENYLLIKMLCNAHRAADVDLDREVGELLRKEEKLIGAMRYVRICY